MVKGDSAASSHYWREKDKQILKNIKKSTDLQSYLPNNSSIKADRKGQLSLSEELSPQAKMAMVLPYLKSATLISIGQLCNDNCDVLINKINNSDTK